MGWEQYPWNDSFWPEEPKPEQEPERDVYDDVPPINFTDSSRESKSLELIASIPQSTLSFDEPQKKQSFKKESQYDWGVIGALIHFAGAPVFGAGCMQYGLRLIEKYPSESMPRWMPESLIAAGLGLMFGGAYLCIKGRSDEQAKNREHLKKMQEKYPENSIYALWYRPQSENTATYSKRGDKHAS